MTQKLATLKHKPEITLREFRTTVFGVCFASIVATVGIVVGAKPTALSALAAYHQKACSENPILLGWTQHVLPVMPTVVGLLLFLPLACACWTFVQQLRETSRLYRRVQCTSGPVPSKVAGVARTLDIRDRIVCVRDPGAYAFCFGFFSPRVCISTGMVGRLSRQELEAVLLHESSHLRNRDPLRLLVSRVMASALVLLPVAGELRARYHLAMELAADNMALARLPVEVVASALLKVFTSPGASPQYKLVAVGPLDVTRERIASLAGKSDARRTPRVPYSSLLASTFVALALFIGTVGFSEASGYWATQAHDCTPVQAASVGSSDAQHGQPKPTTKCSHGDDHLEILSAI